MAFLHSLGMVHRDLKSANLLLSNEEVVTLIDFGTARVVLSRSSSMNVNVGTAQYQAPEVFEGKKYTEKADVYSFSIVLWEIMTQKEPFLELSSFEIPDKVLGGYRPPIPVECNKQIVKLLHKCWHSSAGKRPKFKKVACVLRGLIRHTPRYELLKVSSGEFVRGSRAAHWRDLASAAAKAAQLKIPSVITSRDSLRASAVQRGIRASPKPAHDSEKCEEAGWENGQAGEGTSRESLRIYSSRISSSTEFGDVDSGNNRASMPAPRSCLRESRRMAPRLACTGRSASSMFGPDSISRHRRMELRASRIRIQQKILSRETCMNNELSSEKDQTKLSKEGYELDGQLAKEGGVEQDDEPRRKDPAPFAQRDSDQARACVRPKSWRSRQNTMLIQELAEKITPPGCGSNTLISSLPSDLSTSKLPSCETLSDNPVSGPCHAFSRHNFSSPVSCHFCSKLIMSMGRFGKSGCLCTTCGFSAHKKCASKAKKSTMCDRSFKN